MVSSAFLHYYKMCVSHGFLDLENSVMMSEAEQTRGFWLWSWLCEKHGSPSTAWSSFLRRCRDYWFWEMSSNKWKKGAVFRSVALAQSCTWTQWILPVDCKVLSFWAWAASPSEGVSWFITYPPAMQATLKGSSICRLHNLSPKLGYFLRENENTKVINGRMLITAINSDASGKTGNIT